ncbi:MAG TPA: hypothetical protein VM581_05290 [Magnetospirillaceae bacterium]|nr:hypothetical protein [Magnetospirillaceae bacterium]
MASTPVAPGPNSKSFIDRELHGASFLALEHTAHMILAVAVPGLIVSAISTALTMWFSTSSSMPMLDIAYYGGGWMSTMSAIGLTAALVALVPLMLVLGRRTRAEWHKRAAFISRLAYKVPVYGALAATTVVVIWFKIQMLSVLLATLAFIGVPNAPFATLYSGVFLPALIGYVIFGIAWWYIFKLVKGTDYGKIFSIIMAILGAGIAVALFITSTVSLHGSGKNSNPLSPTQPDPGPIYYKDEHGTDYYR